MIFKCLQKYTFYFVLFFAFTSCNDKSREKTGAEIGENGFLQEWRTELQNNRPDTLERRLIGLGLVDVQSVNPNILVDLKYATTDNFMKTNVYGNLRRAYLQKEVAHKLSAAQYELSKIDGNLHLLVYDAVRPRWVQYKMWNLLDTIPVYKRTKFVSNPKNGSVHNYGAAVDLTICDRSGTPLDMGAGFDDPREIAYPSKESYFLLKGELTDEQITNRQLLRKVMKLAGFYNLQTEWWHFNAMTRNAAKQKYEVIL